MRPGDRVFIYHSMGDACIVGLAKVASAPRPDPANAKLTVVEFEFLNKLEPPTTLREIKESGLFADWELVRQSRSYRRSKHRRPRNLCRSPGWSRPSCSSPTGSSGTRWQGSWCPPCRTCR